jgi:hypothetical protein
MKEIPGQYVLLFFLSAALIFVPPFFTLWFVGINSDSVGMLGRVGL